MIFRKYKIENINPKYKNDFWFLYENARTEKAKKFLIKEFCKMK